MGLLTDIANGQNGRRARRNKSKANGFCPLDVELTRIFAARGEVLAERRVRVRVCFTWVHSQGVRCAQRMISGTGT